MNSLVVYDVETLSRDGQRRLRRVAKLCEGYGQRVQYSVFEVVCSRTKMAKLVVDLEAAIDPRCDSIRIYPLASDGLERVLALGLRRELRQAEAWVL